MYLPASFQETDQGRLFDLMEAYSFGMLIVPRDGGDLEISHLPFLLDRTHGPHGALRCHVARPNPIWKLASDGRPVTAIFSGPHAYVSARFYEHPEEQVPTWNYAVVHARGAARTPISPPELLTLVRDLSALHEHGSENPWSPEQTTPGFIEKLSAAIVGLHIPITHLEAKFKLSQNRSSEDQSRVQTALANRASPDDLAMLKWMRVTGGGRGG